MALLTKIAMFGDLRATIYFYENVGDELPVHVHDETTNHVTVISIGSFRCTGNPAIEGSVLTQGMVVDWPANQPHGFVALEPGCKMIQIGKSMSKPLTVA